MPAWRYDDDDDDDDDDGDVTCEESAETISFLTTRNIIHRFWRHSQAPLFQNFCATFRAFASRCLKHLDGERGLVGAAKRKA